jgi:hypothetical protein
MQVFSRIFPWASKLDERASQLVSVHPGSVFCSLVFAENRY